MIVKYKVEGIIEVDLNDDEIRELNYNKSETMKKDYLEQVLERKLKVCEMTAEQELDVNVNFDDLFIVCDWNKYAGNMRAKNEQHGSPQAIFIDDIPITEKEMLGNTMKDIANRKTNRKKNH